VPRPGPRVPLRGPPSSFHGRAPWPRRLRRRLLPLAAGARGRLCRAPLISEQQLCTRCRNRVFHFHSNFALFDYAGQVRELIYQLKFANRRSLAPLFASLLAPVVERDLAGLPIVPVPGNPRAVRRRGWDPMMEVSRELSRRCRTVALPLLRRSSGAAQKALSYEERIRNLRGTFTLRRAPPRRVLLLDDVFTTGATADECARVILAGGGQSVRVLTVAID